jgi:hypothetical protein
MSPKLETPEPIEQGDAASLGDTLSPSVILRKRVTAVFILVLAAVMLTICCFYQTKLVENGSTRRSWFLETVAVIGIWVVFGIVQVLRKTPKL